MAHIRSWFGQGPLRDLLQPGQILQLSHPEESRWKINEIIKEHDHQMDQASMRKEAPSYASLRVSCSSADDLEPTLYAMMRVYCQIPYTNTELEPSTIRARQATKFKPKELKALQILSKDSATSSFTPSLLGYHESQLDISGLVPGGFIIFLAWDIVPGLPLGSAAGWASGFWNSVPDLDERNLIRTKFKETLLLICAAGIQPEPFCASNLLWDSETLTLFWVGFREWISCIPVSWSDVWWHLFDLVKVPRGNKPLRPEWDGDTSQWQW